MTAGTEHWKQNTEAGIAERLRGAGGFLQVALLDDTSASFCMIENA